MSVDTQTGRHIPANSMVFEFDAEVVSVFDNMASRSIVGYAHAHKMIGHFASRHPWPEFAEVWDFGTTTANGLRTIRHHAGLQPYIDYHGTDISSAAVKRCRENHPWARFHEADLTKGLFPEFEALERFPIQMIIFGYTLQFIEDTEVRKRLIREAYDAVAVGGMVFVLEKYRYTDPHLNKVTQDAYMQFRRDNGYTLEEIKAKSDALKNSMWPTSPDFMRTAMEDAGFATIHTLYRELNFGGFVAIK